MSRAKFFGGREGVRLCTPTFRPNAITLGVYSVIAWRLLTSYCIFYLRGEVGHYDPSFSLIGWFVRWCVR